MVFFFYSYCCVTTGAFPAHYHLYQSVGMYVVFGVGVRGSRGFDAGFFAVRCCAIELLHSVRAYVIAIAGMWGVTLQALETSALAFPCTRWHPLLPLS